MSPLPPIDLSVFTSDGLRRMVELTVDSVAASRADAETDPAAGPHHYDAWLDRLSDADLILYNRLNTLIEQREVQLRAAREAGK